MIIKKNFHIIYIILKINNNFFLKKSQKIKK